MFRIRELITQWRLVLTMSWILKTFVIAVHFSGDLVHCRIQEEGYESYSYSKIACRVINYNFVVCILSINY